MGKREGRVYYSEKKGQRNAIIVFDRGHPYGDIHVYELRESIEVGRIEKEIAEALGLKSLPDAIAKNVVEHWVEKRFGQPTVSWKITEQVFCDTFETENTKGLKKRGIFAGDFTRIC